MFAGKDDVYPNPSLNFRFSGYLSKLGEGRAAWKKRWCHIDGTTGWLYWWNKPDGKVLGALPLLDTVLTTLPAPEFGFRLSWGNRFRDFRADSQQSQKMWEKHLSDEISSRSGTKKKKKTEDDRPISDAGMESPTVSKITSNKAQERIRELEAEVLILKQTVKALEAENQELKNDEPDQVDPEALKMLNEMNLEDKCPSEDADEKIDDLTFQLNSAKKRLKAANETIKLQAQRIQLLESSK